jgi:hypothetical protein
LPELAFNMDKRQMNKNINPQSKPDKQTKSNNNLPNDEWELEEFIEQFAAELDKVQDTISLKSFARGLTFGPNAITLQVNVFPRYDSELKKVFYRTAMPGELGATMLKLEIPSLLRDQIQIHGIQFQNVPDTRPLSVLSGVTSAQIISLNQLGIFMVGDLKAMVITPEMRTLVSTKAGVSVEMLSKWLRLPYIRSVKQTSKGVLGINGDNFGSSEQKKRQVLLDDTSAEIIKWSDKKIQVKINGKVFRLLVVVNDEGVSNRYPLPEGGMGAENT